MTSARLIFLAICFLALSGRAQESFHLAEEQFRLQLNSLEGIEIVGGPFKTAERYTFSGVSGYFVLAPETVVPGLDQRLTVQTRSIDPTSLAASTSDPVTAPVFPSDLAFKASSRADLLMNFAQLGFAEERNEVTVFESGSVHSRRVQFVPVVSVRSLDEEKIAVLFGAAPWQGVPLVQARFDRTRGNADLEFLRTGFTPSFLREIPLRPAPIFAPQTFWAEGTLPVGEWQKVLSQLAMLENVPAEIVAAQVNERDVIISTDYRRPVIPSACAAFHSEGGGWELEWAIELRAQFPQPAAWWCFLPLLERPSTALVARLAGSLDAELSPADRRELIETSLRLRGAGMPEKLRVNGSAAVVNTRCGGSRGFELQFTKKAGKWRLSGFLEVTT